MLWSVAQWSDNSTPLIYGKGLAKYQKYQDELFAPYFSEEELYKLKDIKDELESNAANWNWTILDMQPSVESLLSDLGDIISEVDNYLE